MKASEFVKYVIVPVLLAVLLASLFHPLCVENGECDYLKLWFFMGDSFWYPSDVPLGNSERL